MEARLTKARENISVETLFRRLEKKCLPGLRRLDAVGSCTYLIVLEVVHGALPRQPRLPEYRLLSHYLFGVGPSSAPCGGLL